MTDTKACTKCGEVKPITAFYANARSKDGRRPSCKACSYRQWRKRRDTDPDYADRHRAYNEDYRARKGAEAIAAGRARIFTGQQVDSLPGAVNRGKQWTGPQLELVADRSRSIKDVARVLGRTAYAVREMRRQLQVDPRKIRLAGIPDRGDQP